MSVNDRGTISSEICNLGSIDLAISSSMEVVSEPSTEISGDTQPDKSHSIDDSLLQEKYEDSNSSQFQTCIQYKAAYLKKRSDVIRTGKNTFNKLINFSY